MSEPVLRLARPEDVPAIEGLLSAEWLPPFQIAEFLETFWVLEQDGRVLGAAGLEVYGEAGFIRSVVVDPSLRGTRQGERLVRRALEEAKSQGVKRMYLFTGSAADFFSRFGFELCGMDDFEPAVKRSWQFIAISQRPEIAEYVKPMRATI
jgi:amino-acid N-acetyltransferase